MATETLRKRGSQAIPEPLPDLGAGTAGKAQEPHPAGPVKHGPVVQLIRMLLFAAWFITCVTVTGITQWIGSPLYFCNRDYYYAYMAFTKQCFGILINTVTQWFSPTVIYTDWLYLWWFSYTSKMHGHLYIILKESLKYIPVIGPGMMFFGFIFMARKWSSDKPRLQYRLSKLKAQHGGPMAGSPSHFDPMWLMIFPEGTNLSANTRKRSVKWSQTQGIPDMKHQLLPRSTGLLFCLRELKDSVDFVYDCTMAYEGVPKGGYAQDYFTLRSFYFQGRPPKSVNMYWRRFAIADIPLDDDKVFDAWLTERWREKDGLLQQYFDTGRFPAGTEGLESGLSDDGFVNTEVCLEHWWEVGQIFVIVATTALIVNIIVKLLAMFSRW